MVKLSRIILIFGTLDGLFGAGFIAVLGVVFAAGFAAAFAALRVVAGSGFGVGLLDAVGFSSGMTSLLTDGGLAQTVYTIGFDA
jgi:hypothetical protein